MKACTIFATATLYTITTAAAVAGGCIPSGDQNAVNAALKNGGPNAVVNLCYNAVFKLTAPIVFTNNGQKLIGINRAVSVEAAPGSSISTLIRSQDVSGITLEGIQVNGNRATLGAIRGGGGTIEMGGKASNINITSVDCQGARGSSCLYLYGGANCRNIVVSVGGYFSTTDVDPIRLNCWDSDVFSLQIKGFSGFGINVLGASGSWIHDNDITSTSRSTAKAGIAMVDPKYDYEGVQVYGNMIRGAKLLSVGIAVGSHVFAGYNNNPDQPFAQGPVNITKNSGSGRIGFLMAVNGWGNGLNASTFLNTFVDKRRLLSSSFVDTAKCDKFVKDAIVKSTNYTYWQGGLEGGPNTLTKGFYPMKGNGQNFECMQPAKQIKTYKRGQINLAPGANSYLCNFSDVGALFNEHVVFFITRTDGEPIFIGEVGNEKCRFKFDNNGDFYQTDTGTGEIYWSSGTKGKGETLECLAEYPYLRIRDAAGKEIWKPERPDSEL